MDAILAILAIGLGHYSVITENHGMMILTLRVDAYQRKLG
jgi:hypothetical protein